VITSEPVEVLGWLDINYFCRCQFYPPVDLGSPTVLETRDLIKSKVVESEMVLVEWMTVSKLDQNMTEWMMEWKLERRTEWEWVQLFLNWKRQQRDLVELVLSWYLVFRRASNRSRTLVPVCFLS
jgi:hypothetical protein